MDKKILSLLLMIPLVASGCLSVPEGVPEPVEQPEPDPLPVEDPADPPDEPEPWLPPTARLSADIAKGPLPLNVAFTLEGSTDPRGSISWLLEFGDGNIAHGGGLPATVEHGYAEEGVYTANLTVTDGAQTANAQLDLLAVEPQLHRFYFREDGPLDAPDIIPTGIGANGNLSLEPGNVSRAVATMGPLYFLPEEVDQIPQNDWLVFTSEPLNQTFTLTPGVENVTDLQGRNWTVSSHAAVHYCMRGNLNGLFLAKIYEVDEGGNETLVLTNNAREYAGTGILDGACGKRHLSFESASASSHVFSESSRIRVTIAPDIYPGSIAGQFRFNGPEEPFDSSLDLHGYFL